MEPILNLVVTSLEKACLSLLHNWPYLLVGVLVAALLKLYVDTEAIAAFLKRSRGLGVAAATAVAVSTPLCSCGTTAIVLGMMASTMPWAPIVAFMVASPLTSPEGLLYSAGLFGWPFAWAFFIASILLGLAGGAAAALIENWGWLVNQTRFTDPTKSEKSIPGPTRPTPGCGCAEQSASAPVSLPAVACGCVEAAPAYSGEMFLISLNMLQPIGACARETAAGARIPGVPGSTRAAPGQPAVRSKPRPSLADIWKEICLGGKKLLPMFLGFAFLGYFLNGLIPASWVTAIFGAGNIYSVPLAATLGLPLYLNSEGSLPLVRAMLDNGMSQGAALAFIISGAGTSLGAVAGALTIARWRVVGLVIGVLWLGAILVGFSYDLLLAFQII